LCFRATAEPSRFDSADEAWSALPPEIQRVVILTNEANNKAMEIYEEFAWLKGPSKSGQFNSFISIFCGALVRSPAEDATIRGFIDSSDEARADAARSWGNDVFENRPPCEFKHYFGEYATRRGRDGSFQGSGIPEGTGVMLYNDGAEFYGEFANGKPSGWGMLYEPRLNQLSQGEFDGRCMNGVGIVFEMVGRRKSRVKSAGNYLCGRLGSR